MMKNRAPQAGALKTMRHWLVPAALAMAGALTFGTAVQAREGGMDMHGGPDMGMHGEQGLPMAGRGLERMLDGVNASADQRTRIKAIADAAANDLRALHESGRALREQGMALFSQPTVDANAVEALRQKQLQQHDQATRRMTQAMLDISRVLTAEQRQQMAERMKQRRDMFERHMREHAATDGTKPAP